MKNEGYLDLSTIAIEVSFTLYNTKFDYYVTVVLLLEQSAGNLFPSRSIVIPYKLNPF